MKVPRFPTAIGVVLALTLAVAAVAQDHRPAPPQSPVPQGAQPAHPPTTEGHGEAAGHEGNPVLSMIARLFNFAVLVGVLVYFLKAPIAGYLGTRDTQIRHALVTAADMRATATAQLAEIEKKMAALPGELEALRRQGAEDVKAEQARIAQAAVQERNRLLEQTRREIAMRLRIAKRELTEHAAQLAVHVAERRITRAISADDQMRLVDRYASQLKEAR